MPTSTELAEELWVTDLDCQRANEEIWATGRDLPDDDPRMRRALDGDERCGELVEGLRARAGVLALVPLGRLVGDADRWPQSAEAFRAAAAVRVFDTDTYLADAEALQPGVELPAVGVYAELVD
jgi:hypothetical protein